MSYIGNSPTSIAFLTDLFTGTGSLTTFTMSAAPASTSSILVSITGIVQEPSTYAVSGNTLTFSQAPPAGTGNVSVRYLGIPASNIVSTAYRTVTEFTATLAQTIFTVPSYTVGYITVYRNGARLGTADYTASSGTNVILTVAANTGDLVTTESFYVSSVLNAIPAVAGAVTSSYLLTGAVTSAKIANSVALVTPNIGVATATSLTTGALTATSIIGLTTPLSEAQGGTGVTSVPHTVQVFTSGSGTYTLPTNCKAIKVTMVGGGGGGTGGNNGANAGVGGSTTFGTSYLISAGGNGASSYIAGAGGNATGGISPCLMIAGGSGGNGIYGLANAVGAKGGSSAFGGGASGGAAGASGSPAGQVNTGGGGGGGGVSTNAPAAGAGGGAAGYIEQLIASPLATYSYAVGAGGTATAAGSSAGAGGAGGSGVIIVEEYYV